tara:strand:+ start:25080 stop:25883 length:804 start_codon:yes stop_codon:yes gene_type:complete
VEAIQAIVLGLTQGITEFLPISSSAHLILLPVFTGWPDQGVSFDLAVHLGTLVAVVLYFRHDVRVLTLDGMRSLRERRQVGQSRLTWSLLIGTLPAGFAGLLLLDLIDTTLRSVPVIFTTTLVFALLLAWADRRGRSERSLDDFTWRDALWVGCAQALSLVPGTSRSGATLTAGLLLGLSREAAARFSFLLAIPITGLAASVKLAEAAFLVPVRLDWSVLLIGGLTSFLTALLAIHYFLKLLNVFGMWPYVLYRLALAGLLYTLFLN